MHKIRLKNTQKEILLCIAITMIFMFIAMGCSKKDLRTVDLIDANGQHRYLLDIQVSQTDFYTEENKKTALQTVTYEPLSDLEFAKQNYTFEDVNNDGYADFRVPKDSNVESPQYYFFIFHPEEQKFIYQKTLSDLVNPQEDLASRMIFTDIDTGKSGIVQCEYKFNGFDLELENVSLSNADTIIEIIVEETIGIDAVPSIKTLNSTDVRVQLQNGTNLIDDEECTIYSAIKSDKKRAYFAVNQYGKWYEDQNNKGNFKPIEGYDGLKETEIKNIMNSQEAS